MKQLIYHYYNNVFVKKINVCQCKRKFNNLWKMDNRNVSQVLDSANVLRYFSSKQSPLRINLDEFIKWCTNKLKIMGILNPLNIFLRQEIDRMQKVLTNVRQTLKELLLAIEGIIIMNESLRDALDNIYDARVPFVWRRGSWTANTLGFWFTELLERNNQFKTWCFGGRPLTFWMAGFFNPQGFLTAMKQEVARAHKGWALDQVTLNNVVTKNTKEEILQAPVEGVYVYGLYLDGAGWDKRNAKLNESINKVLYTLLPVVHIFASYGAEIKTSQLYVCPVYKKIRRTGLNYITSLYLQTAKSPDHWVLRGVALLCDTQ